MVQLYKMGESRMIILFDLDGTLIDSTEAILESFHHSLDKHNHPKQSDEDIKVLIGYPLDIMFERLGVEENIVADAVATYKEHYRDISTQKTILLDGAKEAIQRASGFAKLGIVTTKTALYSKVLMEHFGVMHHFDVLIGREDVEYPKPHPQPILKALEKFDTLNKEIWMIGDTKLDLISAKEANINSLAVLSGYDTKETLQNFTQNIFSDVSQAINFLHGRSFK